MKTYIVTFSLAVILSLSAISFAQDQEYFYCGYTDMDGSAQDYSKWGKGTDFKYNEAKKRWEWVTEFTFQYIYPSGKYEQKTRVSFFENQKGQCNEAMEKIYKEKMKKLLKK